MNRIKRSRYLHVDVFRTWYGLRLASTLHDDPVPFIFWPFFVFFHFSFMWRWDSLVCNAVKTNKDRCGASYLMSHIIFKIPQKMFLNVHTYIYHVQMTSFSQMTLNYFAIAILFVFDELQLVLWSEKEILKNVPKGFFKYTGFVESRNSLFYFKSRIVCYNSL